jgi:trans-aconitate methyltransferase
VTFDASVANVARIYDYLLGGKDNFEADRTAARELLRVLPDVAGTARENREFLQRAVRTLAGEAGIRQFLDIGAGLPTMGNVHEAAQEVAPGAVVAYVDYDPMVLSHARAILANQVNVVVIDGDLRSPKEILAKAAERIDFSEPAAILLVAILHFVPDSQRPYELVRTLIDALAPGSYLVLTHGSSDGVPTDTSAAGTGVYAQASAQVTSRSLEEVTRFFDGLDLLDPGIVDINIWRPGRHPSGAASVVGRSLVYGGVGVKP